MKNSVVTLAHCDLIPHFFLMQFGPTANDDTNENDDQKKLPLTEMMRRKFLKERKIFFWGEVNDDSARVVTEQFLYLESSDPGKEITFYLNSPGGSITAGMAV
ncbi:MAG TPA: ATP-dependent Clp protease proteolytic subunit, partial [Oceanipulchritudo sp.]|nr:ATP-dependent Clp protease proteolytic subunit [Oceanipulchritudo sp.]